MTPGGRQCHRLSICYARLVYLVVMDLLTLFSFHLEKRFRVYFIFHSFCLHLHVWPSEREHGTPAGLNLSNFQPWVAFRMGHLFWQLFTWIGGRVSRSSGIWPPSWRTSLCFSWTVNQWADQNSCPKNIISSPALGSGQFGKDNACHASLQHNNEHKHDKDNDKDKHATHNNYPQNEHKHGAHYGWSQVRFPTHFFNNKKITRMFPAWLIFFHMLLPELSLQRHSGHTQGSGPAHSGQKSHGSRTLLILLYKYWLLLEVL